MATTPATRCWSRWPPACARYCGRRTPCRGSGATSSRSCARTWTAKTAPPPSPTASPTPWPSPCRSAIARCSSRPRSELRSVATPRWPRACRQARAWQWEFGDQPLRMAVNLSGRQLAHEGLHDAVAGALADANLDADLLCLEITESAVTEDPARARVTLRSLKRLGVRLAIDDFGVGFASLGQIRQLPPADVIKIARPFIV